MSGDKNTNNDPAQFSEINKSSVGSKDGLVEPPDNKDFCSFDNGKSVINSYFDLFGEGTSLYPDTVAGDGGYGGDVDNWGDGRCFDQDLNPVQTVGEEFGIFGTGFHGSEQPGMGSKDVDHQPDDGNVVSKELPACGGEATGCKPVDDNSQEKATGDSLGLIGTEVEVPSYNICDDASKDVNKVSNCSNEMTERNFFSTQAVEKKTVQPAEDKIWESIYEVAKQYEENTGCIPTECDQNMLSHETETVEPLRVLRVMECVKGEVVAPEVVSANSTKSDIDRESLSTDDKVAEASKLHFLKEDPVEDASKNDHDRHNNSDEPVCTGVMVSDPICVESLIKDEGFDEASKIHDVQIEQEQNATSKAEQEKTYVTVQVEKSDHDLGKHSGGNLEGTPAACHENGSLTEQPRQSLQQVGARVNAVVMGLLATDPLAKCRSPRNLFKSNEGTRKSSRGRKPSITSETTLEKSPLQHLTSSSRTLRSKSQEHSITPEPIANLENTQDNSVERRGRKKREVEGKSGDEFSKIRKRLRYLLHRISYERNLLDAYSSEGWRGQSVEKLRPEKELERAKADINRAKVKIRELFHRLDSMSGEGKFPDTLYDSEGLIDCEDIFCAKCGSKDLLTGNDIILCDGSCDRGFHQYCLEPPLLTEEIPPGDEGWFCPACDCKFDCLELLNDSQGAKLTMEDSWEKVFPEAVEVVGLKQDDLMGLPSDDSDDNDYNPGGQDDDFKDEAKNTSSDESDSDESDSSDFSSASEDLEAVCKESKDDTYLGLPSDDSQDNDFDPDTANASNNDEDEGASSSSDFSSASEDLRAVGGDETLENEESSLAAELDRDLGDSLPLSSKRQVERLDYKKLFDETYGAVSDSSDDEEWADGVATTTRKTTAKREVLVSTNKDVSASNDGSPSTVTPNTRRGRPKRDLKVENKSSVEPQKTPQETSSSGKSKKRPPYNKLPESVTQRLYESFKEKQYPDHATKEKLAAELGLTPFRVDKWFGNARWSYNHHPSRVEACIARVVPGGGTPSTHPIDADSSKSDIASSGKRKESETQAQPSQTPSPMNPSKESIKETPEVLGRGQRKRRKSSS